MDSGYSVLMFCFSGAILLYAGLIARTKDTRLIARSWAARMDDKPAYARRFARVLAWTAIAPLLSGLVALCGDAAWVMPAALIVLVFSLILALFLALRKKG